MVDMRAMSKIVIAGAIVAILIIAAIATVLLMGGNGGDETPEIEVDKPQGGSSYVAGSALTIEWSTSGETGAAVKIEYGYTGGPLTTIVASAPNNGLYSWNIPSDMVPRTTYYVRVTSNSNTSVFDNSDAFTITEQGQTYVGTIVVTSPEAGSSSVRGTALNIQWTTTGNIGTNVKIEWLHTGGVTNLITDTTANDGSHSWNIPDDQEVDDDYQIRVTSLANTSIFDDSGVFAITSSGGSGPQVGQFVNYTVNMTVTEDSVTVYTDSFYRYSVIAVNATSVTYNFTIGTYIMGSWYLYYFEPVANLTDTSFGYDPNTEYGDENVTMTLVGTESLSTPWGSKSCQKYSVVVSGDAPGSGYIWIFNDNIMLRYEFSQSSADSETSLLFILTDTNLSGVTG